MKKAEMTIEPDRWFLVVAKQYYHNRITTYGYHTFVHTYGQVCPSQVTGCHKTSAFIDVRTLQWVNNGVEPTQVVETSLMQRGHGVIPCTSLPTVHYIVMYITDADAVSTIQILDKSSTKVQNLRRCSCKDKHLKRFYGKGRKDLGRDQDRRRLLPTAGPLRYRQARGVHIRVTH